MTQWQRSCLTAQIKPKLNPNEIAEIFIPNRQALLIISSPEPPSLLSASQWLSEQSESDRIHKLLYWTVTGQWESSLSILNQRPIQVLFQQLIEGTPTLRDLEHRLYQAAAQLSRPEKYQQIAKLIIRGGQSLYGEGDGELLPASLWSKTEDNSAVLATTVSKVSWPAMHGPYGSHNSDNSHSSQINRPGTHQASVPVRPSPSPHSGADYSAGHARADHSGINPPGVSSSGINPPGVNPAGIKPSGADHFEVRRILMQQVPPLKAKILMFSLLRRPFIDRYQDWLELKAQSLDAWIVELVQTFPNPQVLEDKLFAQASQITSLDQGLQVAAAIAQSTRLRSP